MGETHTLKIRMRVWKKKTKNNFIYFWLSPFLSVVYQWVLRSQAHIFWAPLVYVWGINSLCGWSNMYAMNLCWWGDIWFDTRGFWGSWLIYTASSFLFFWGSTERGMGSCRQVLWRPAFELSERRHSVYWTASREGHTEESSSQDSRCKELNPHSNYYKQRGRRWLRKRGKDPVMVHSSLRQIPQV